MEEKKLTDEQIINALKSVHKETLAFAYDKEQRRFDYVTAKEILDLIHRLQSENADLIKKNEALYYSGLNENTARLGDMRTIESLEDKVAEQKAEIGRLTERKEYFEIYANLLQKQVDELDGKFEKEYAEFIIRQAKAIHEAHERGVQETKYLCGQAVKDTAKEILQMLHDIGGCDATDEWSKGYDAAIDTAYEAVKKRYGVEVE